VEGVSYLKAHSHCVVLVLCLVEQGRGMKSIGKVVTKGTKQIGKTLTTMSDSPNKRGQSRMNHIQNPQFRKSEARKEKKKTTKMVAGSSLGLDTGRFFSHQH
jgi:hypothetical protein